MTYTGIQQTHNKCADSNQSSCMAFVTTNFPFFIAPIRCSWHSFNNKRCACVSPHFGNSLHIFISILILICNKWNVTKCCKINMKLRYVHICHWNIKMINNVMFRTKHAPPTEFIHRCDQCWNAILIECDFSYVYQSLSFQQFFSWWRPRGIVFVCVNGTCGEQWCQHSQERKT